MKRTKTSLALLLTMLPALSAGCGEDGAPDMGAGMATGLAVVSADRMSSSISLVDPQQGTLVRDQCLHSGTSAPQLSVALSDDVVLPSQPQAGNELLVIDRKNSTLTWVAPTACAVARQLRVGDFAANPHDVVSLGPTKAYVTRYNAKPGSMDEGSDVLVIHPQEARVLSRIDLRAHVAQGDAPADKPILPFPSRALAADGKAYVVLNALSGDFKAAGPGRVVVIDPSTDTVSATIELPGLKNCGGLDHVPAARALLVSCGGPYSDGPKQIESSGYAWIALDASPPTVKVVQAAGFGRPVSGFRVAAVSEDLVFGMTEGDFGGPGKDTLWSFDFKGGTPKKIFEASAAYVLAFFVDRGNKRLYALEASDMTPKVHVFATDGASGPEKRGELTSNPAAGLPPKHMGWY